MDNSEKDNGKVAVVLGAGGGIGGALLSRLAADSKIDSIVATHRIPVDRTASHPDAALADKLQWHTLDLESPASVARCAQTWLQQLTRIDYFVCATGLLHDSEIQPEKRLQKLSDVAMQRLYQVNAAGPLSFVAALEPLFKRALAPRLVFLSAQVGSIADNQLGGWYSYRMSKAALNMGVRTLAIEATRWRNDPVVMAVHPGTTATQLSDPFIANRKQAVRCTAETAANIHRLIQQADERHHGQFFTAEGTPLPW